jgi:tetratricopeptide (TPR) repeat protein
VVRGGTFNNPVATVVGVSRDYYLVHWRGHEGWVKRDDFVVGDERPDYFLERARRDPSDAYAQRVCAQNLLSANLFDTALPYLDAAARLAPNDVAVHQAQAIVLAMKRNPAAARDALAAAERIDPSDPTTYALRALLLWQPLKQRDRAVADFDKAIRLAPQDETLYFMRAKFWRSEGDPARALADLDTSIRLWPEFLAAHVERAELLANCPDRAVANPKEAVASARRACDLTRWEDPAHIRRLARMCEADGNYDEGACWREKAEQMEGGSAGRLPPLPPAPPEK